MKYKGKKQSLRQQRVALKRLAMSHTARVALFVFCVVAGFLYIWQTNTVSTKGYMITELEQNIRQLEYENRKIEVEIAEKSSLTSVEQRLDDVKLVAVDHVEYVDVLGGAVAQR